MLTPAFEDQERAFANAFQVLRRAISAKVFPGASVAITLNGMLVANQGFGALEYGPPSAAVMADTIFDLASLTKVIATTSMAMLLYDRGTLDLDLPVSRVLPQFGSDDGRKQRITARMLLAHSSGLPAYMRLFEHAKTRGELLAAAFKASLGSDPGTRAEYSDIGFLVLGELLHKLAGQPLDAFCQRNIFQDLEMYRTQFNPPAALKNEIPPTVLDRLFRKKVIQGEVHDENASVLDGVAAHAGLFGSAPDVARFAHCILSGGAPLFRPATVALFTRKEDSPLATSRALGWDTPTAPSQSGKHFSPGSFGHLGYTGTSLWIDPLRQLSVTLLSNRTWPDCSSQEIRNIRPVFHDAVIEAL